MLAEKSLDRVLIVVVGATASGKSALSLELARHLSCPIISTDSRQIYRGIPIGTAQPSAEELAEIKHHFIASRELADEYNAGRYEEDAISLLDKLFENHSVVVAVGGSGLYIKALCEGLDAMPEVSEQLRSQLRAEYAEHGLEPLLKELERSDPELHSTIDRANHSRVLRALEVCRAGGSCTDVRKGEVKERPFKIIKVGLDLPRPELYERIDRRVHQMVEMGLIAEAQAVYPLRALNSLQTVGYRELFAHFDGEYDLDRAIELIQRNSRRYAKRQMTWFRADKQIEWFEEYNPRTIIEYIDKKL
ncbi:MAG: tRNA (adenosine(37)-N6)-dimethylallyltransferase MiaA [Rikenellaceae bacterium]